MLILKLIRDKLQYQLFHENFRRILKIEPPIPDDLSPPVKDFICKMLIKEPRQRLGGGPTDATEVKSHAFFKVMKDHTVTAKHSITSKREPVMTSVTALNITNL